MDENNAASERWFCSGALFQPGRSIGDGAGVWWVRGVFHVGGKVCWRGCVNVMVCADAHWVCEGLGFGMEGLRGCKDRYVATMNSTVAANVQTGSA